MNLGLGRGRGLRTMNGMRKCRQCCDGIKKLRWITHTFANDRTIANLHPHPLCMLSSDSDALPRCKEAQRTRSKSATGKNKQHAASELRLTRDVMFKTTFQCFHRFSACVRKEQAQNANKTGVTLRLFIICALFLPLPESSSGGFLLRLGSNRRCGPSDCEKNTMTPWAERNHLRAQGRSRPIGANQIITFGCKQCMCQRPQE